MKDAVLSEVGVKKKYKRKFVICLAAQQSALDGVVASGQEIGLIRKK